MHNVIRPYALELEAHADKIDRQLGSANWGKEISVGLEISLVYTAVVIRKLWEHYQTLYKEVGFDLNATFPDLHRTGSADPQSVLTYVHRIIHSQRLDTGPETLAAGICVRSDHRGEFVLPYRRAVDLIRRAAAATRAIED